MNHLLDIKDLTKKDILNICTLAQKIKLGLVNFDLSDIKICNIFNEPSTRTFMSFKVAQQNLNMPSFDLISQMSSLTKGETLFDCVEVMKSYNIKNFVIRDKNNFFYQELLKIADINIINAGDGINQHPTQALLNIFTLLEHFNFDLKGKNFLFVGDLIHSRVFKSDLEILKHFGGNYYSCCPRNLVDSSEIVKPVSKVSDVINEIDVCCAYRLQYERHEQNYNFSNFNQLFGLNKNNLKNAKKEFVFMHPGPVNYGIEIAAELKNAPQSLILKQVENGMYIRMAILAIINKKVVL